MPPRLRSKPFGPDSPNAVQGLPDPPRRRRATRSASAQPQQEDKPAQPVRQPKARKTRGKAASRGKKKATRRTSPSPPPPADPQPEQLEGDETVSHTEATGEMQDRAPAYPSVEIPVTVLPSIENSDPELTTPAPGVCESLPFFFRLASYPPSFFSTRPLPPTPTPAPTPAPSESSSSTNSISTGDSANQPRGWLMSQLRSLYRLCTHSVPAVSITAPAVGWSQNIPMLKPDMGQSESALDDIELMSIIRAVRSTGTASNRRPNRRLRISPSSSVDQSQVLRAQGASPIHRSRTSYANRSNSRRIESRGSFGRTLYRFPQLLSMNSQPELQTGSEEGTSPADEQDPLNPPLATADPETAPPTTPERASAATPGSPMTAPPVSTDISPGWSRWIFNGVSRRWTVLRGRFAHHDVNENAHQSAAAADEPAAPTTPATPGSSVRATQAAPATSPVVARTAPTGQLAFPPMYQAQTTTSLPHDPSPSPPPSRAPVLPRRRGRTYSYVDTRTLLYGEQSTSIEEGHKAQREFVKRRQAARLALEKEKRDAKLREEKLAREAARPKEHYASSSLQSPTRFSPKSPAKVSPNSPARVSRGTPSTSPKNRSPLTTRAQPVTPYPHGRVSPLTSASQIAYTPANDDAGKKNPLKRSRGFGLDEEDLAVSEDDFSAEEWETVKAQVEKAEEDAAKAAQENIHPTKKRRVDTTTKQKRIRQPVRSQTGTPRRNEAPCRTPGFISNTRGTLLPPDLSPIESSRLMSTPDSPSNPQDPASLSSQKGMTGSLASSPRLPTPRSSAMKKTRGFHPPDPYASSSSLDLPSTPPCRSQRNRGFEAPDPWASSSSSPSLSSSPLSSGSPSSRLPRRSMSTKDSLPPRKLPPHLRLRNASPQPKKPVADASQRHLAASDAERLAAQQAETEAETDGIEGSSPLTRARNKAEQFKPKTPSRLRESTRIPSSNTSTPSALGISSPYASDPMSVDGSSYIANSRATPIASSAVNDPERSLADDVAWLLETCPDGNFNNLKWPPRRSLVEALNIDPEAVGIVENSWAEKGADLVRYYEALYQCQVGEHKSF